MSNRNFGLDVLRSISIGMVLLLHMGVNVEAIRPLTIGLIGVEFFFVLSGFLIGGILIREIDKENSLTTLKKFWIRRWLRILPLYYLVLAVKFFFFDHSIQWNILYYIFFLQNNFYGVQYFDVSWSLVIEEWFYIASPLFLMLAFRISKNKKNVIWYLMAFVLSESLFRTLYVTISDVPYHAVNGSPPFRFDALFLGIVLAFLKYYKFPLYQRLQKMGYFLLGIALFLAYTATFVMPVGRMGDLAFQKTVGFLILDVSIGLMLPYIEKFNFIKTDTVAKKAIYYIVTYTSIFTYAIYLIHPFVFGYVFSGKFITANPIVQYSSAVVLTYLIAAAVYYLFEKKILDFRDQITQR